MNENTLKEEFSKFYKLEKTKNCLVADRVKVDGPVWDWKSLPSSAEKLQELASISSIIGLLQPSTSPDTWCYGLNNNKEFFVDTLRHKIDHPSSPFGECTVIWTSVIPIKVSSFIWRISFGRVPTKVALHRRGISLESTSCNHCSEEMEDSYHIFVKYNFAASVWNWVFTWCNISQPNFDSINEILKYAANWGHSPKERNTFLCVCYGTILWIWRARNNMIFKKIHLSPTKVADNIQSMTFLWVKHMRKNNYANWVDWSKYLVSCI